MDFTRNAGALVLARGLDARRERPDPLLGSAQIVLDRLVLGDFPGERGVVPVQVDEHRYLGAQDLGQHRLEQVIHGAHFVTAKAGNGILVGAGQENDRGIARPLAAANQPRRCKAIHARHIHIQQDDGKIFLQDGPQSVLSGYRGNNIAIRAFEHHAQREEQAGIVFDDQDIAYRRVGNVDAPGLGGM